MASVTHGKCNYGKNISGKNIRANETEPFINETTDGIITASSWGLS